MMEFFLPFVVGFGIGCLASLFLAKAKSSTPIHSVSGLDVSSPVGKVAEDKDAWEGYFGDATSPKSARAELLIHYTDGNGKKTERRISTKEFDQNLEGGLLIAHCHLRGATRTFRFDRINSCTDVTTGELITQPGIFLNEVYEKSEAATLDKLANERADTIRSLLYVAKADGRMMSAEREIIAQALVSWSGDDRLNHESVDHLLNILGIPSMQSFEAGAKKAVKNEGISPQELLSWSEKIIHTQKQIVGAEQDALDYLRNKL
jgi:hypothetical protein